MHWCTRSLSLFTLLRLPLAKSVRVDDFDPAVHYNGPWTNAAGDDPSRDWMGTLHYSNISGATATYAFVGTSIAVFGSFNPPGTYSMQSQYSIDGGAPFTFRPNSVVTLSAYQTRFFLSHELPYGPHTIVVTNLGQQFFLDFFEVNTETPSGPSSTTLVASDTTATTETPASSPADTTTHPTPAAAQSTPGRSPQTLSKGAAAGIALSAFVILAVLGAAVFWWFRRSRERSWIATNDMYFEPAKMAVADANFRGHRPTLPEGRFMDGLNGEHSASQHRLSAPSPSSSVHLVGYGASPPGTPSTSTWGRDNGSVG